MRRALCQCGRGSRRTNPEVKAKVYREFSVDDVCACVYVWWKKASDIKSDWHSGLEMMVERAERGAGGNERLNKYISMCTHCKWKFKCKCKCESGIILYLEQKSCRTCFEYKRIIQCRWSKTEFAPVKVTRLVRIRSFYLCLVCLLLGEWAMSVKICG